MPRGAHTLGAELAGLAWIADDGGGVSNAWLRVHMSGLESYEVFSSLLQEAASSQVALVKYDVLLEDDRRS